MSASSWPEDVPGAADPPLQEPAPEPPVRWSFPTRVAFRFAFVYLLLYNLALIFELVEATFFISQKIQEGWALLVQPVSEAIFGVGADVLPNGSGDTTFNYVQIFVMAVLAAIVTIAWSFLDRRRAAYPGLYTFLRVYIRFALGVAMVSYGVYKVIKLQFGDLLLDRLMQPLGTMSPMGLLWTFMGASTAYNFFTGAGEMLGGLLLMASRRTALLGALISAAIMANVAALNFSYDVPVKLYSSHLLLMALFIAAPDLKRMLNIFILNRPAPPAVLRPAFRRTSVKILAYLLRTAFVVAFTGYSLKVAYDTKAEWNRKPLASAPLFGIWNVDELTVDGVVRPPLLTDTGRWRRVVVSSERLFSVHQMNDERVRYMMKDDPKQHTLTLRRGADGAPKGTLTYQRPVPSTLLLRGTVDGHQIEATLHRDDREQLLTTRGFHWINEYPFNR